MDHPVIKSSDVYVLTKILATQSKKFLKWNAIILKIQGVQKIPNLWVKLRVK